MDIKTFTGTAIMNFFIAFGVLFGGCVVGGIGAWTINRPPMVEMNQLVDHIKIWAIVTAIGGTFDTIGKLEQGFLGGAPADVAKHILLIICAMMGAHCAGVLIHWLTQES